MAYTVLTVPSLTALRNVLDAFAIPRRKGWLKTPKQLFGQMRAGECVLTDYRGELIRFTWRAQANIYRVHPNGAVERLVEAERIVNGVRCEPSLGPSVSEKMWALKGENSLDAIIRGCFEELEVEVSESELTFLGYSLSDLVPTKSFPMRNQSCIFLYECFLPFEDTREEYIEARERKFTRWSWK